MLRLPPPKSAQGGQAVEPSVAPTAPSSTALTVQDEVITRGRNNIKTSLSDLVPAGPQASLDRLSIPKQEEDATAQRTAAALSKIVGIKVAATNQLQTSLNAAQNHSQASTFIKVNGSTDSLTGKTSQDRVFRMVEKAADPLEPAKFKFRAAPKPPGSPPVPVLHSPSKKATAEDKAAWDIPASVSNWNNSKGYVISLDKRLAQNAKMEAPALNDRFAKLAEALLSAEDAKRIEVSERAKLKQVNEEKRRETENESLRIAAAQARAARAAAAAALSSRDTDSAPTTGANSIVVNAPLRGSDTPPARRRSKSSSSEDSGKSESSEVIRARRERERLRLQRKREMEREIKLEAAGKRTKAMREEERDVSERVALGMPVPKGSASLETEFDHRLFNRGAAGLSSGHGAEDEDGIYSSSLFRDPSQSVYRPSTEVRGNKTAQDLQAKLDEIKGQEDKFVHRGFKGSDSGGAAMARHGPVQFERSAPAAPSGDDPLHGIALSAAQRRTADVLEGLGNRRAGTMSMGRFAGSSSGSSQPQQRTLDEPDEREEQEERMIRKLKDKESKTKQISFVKGTE